MKNNINNGLIACIIILLLILLSACNSNTSNTVSNTEDISEKIYINDNISSLDETIDNVDQQIKLTPREIDEYTVVDIGKFHNGLARITVFIYKEGYWSSVASNKGYNNGYFLYGYIDIDGNVKIKPIYNDAPEILDMASMVEIYNGANNSSVDIINYEGKSIYPNLDNIVSIGEVHNGLFWVKTVEKSFSGNITTVSYYDYNGNVKFSFENADIVPYYSNSESDSYSNFYYDTATLYINGFARMINNKGEVLDFEAIGFDDDLIPYWGSPYDFVDIGILQQYSSNYAKVVLYMQRPGENIRSEEHYGIIDLNKKTITNTEQNTTYLYTKRAGKYIIYDSFGDNIIYGDNVEKIVLDLDNINEFKNADVIDFKISEDDTVTVYLENVDDDDYFAVLDISGKILISPTNEYHLANYDHYPFQNIKDDEYVFSFSDGLCLAKETTSGKYGYINSSGEWAIEPQYQIASEFSEGYATVNGDTVIDVNGNCILETNNK